MRKVKIEGKLCVGPTHSTPEIKVLKNTVNKNSHEISALAELFALAGSETRLKILYLLYIEKELCVCDIADILNMNVSAISHQLKKLKNLKLVKSRRSGQTIFYSLEKNIFTNCLAEMFKILDGVYKFPKISSRFISNKIYSEK